MTKQLLAAILMEARYQQYRASSFHNQLGRLAFFTFFVQPEIERYYSNRAIDLF